MTRRILLFVLFALLAMSVATVNAQSNPKVQALNSLVSAEVPIVYFDLFSMEAGETIYIYAESEDFDTRIGICDITCADLYVDNDDIDSEGGNFNSALKFTFEFDGDYSIFIRDCCDDEAEGIFRMLVGFNAPDVLDGSAIPNGARIAEPYPDTYTDLTAAVSNDVQIQEFTAFIAGGEDARFTYFDIYDAVGGTTLYVYAESDVIDTYVIICNLDCSENFAENDDIDTDAGNFNSALEFTFPADGDYSVAIADCCEEGNSGEFRLLLGYNAPDVLSGNAAPNGSQIAIPYDPDLEPIDIATGPITGPAQIQEFYALVTEEVNFSYFDLFGMQAGETIYLYVESDDIDPLVFLCDIDCEESFAENDDIDTDAGNFNSALSYTFADDGDYSIAVADCCSDVEGEFRLLIGFNAPQVLSGNALSNGAQIAIPYEPTYIPIRSEVAGGPETQIQQFGGEIGGEVRFVYFDIFDAVAGQTLYIYVKSDEIDPYLIVCDIECIETFAENDDISDRNTNSAIEFTFPADGDYSIAITDCCDDNASGNFILQLGYNAPEVLRGTGIPNGAEIAQVYQPTRPTVPDVERTESADCANLELGERPEMSGPEQTVSTANFIIHYTLQGEDKATEAFVQEVLKFVESVLEIQTQKLGWPAPPRDCGEGGDTRFDFYLLEILDEEILGFAQPENIVGDNTNSAKVETWAAYSYLVIDNDFRGVDPPLSVMRATVAHEFHHGIQFGYDVGDALNWYYESTASWMEIQTSPDDEDATGYTEAVFLYPDVCIGTLNEETGVRVYGEWLLIDSLAQDFGDDSIIRLWEMIADEEGMDSYYDFLAASGSTPQEALGRYMVRNLLRDYAHGRSFPGSVSVEAVINGEGRITPENTGVEEMSADYVLIRRRGNYTFSVNGDNLGLLVVGIDRGTGQAQVFDLGTSGTVDTSLFSNAYVIVLNYDQHTDVNDCTVTKWELSVSDGSGAAQTPATGEIFDAGNFVPAG